MGALFGGNSEPQRLPEPAAPPPAPSVADPSVAVAAEETRRRTAGRGRASTILTTYDEEGTKTGAKQLLGS
jgi:hypothetical protein